MVWFPNWIWCGWRPFMVKVLLLLLLCVWFFFLPFKFVLLFCCNFFVICHLFDVIYAWLGNLICICVWSCIFFYFFVICVWVLLNSCCCRFTIFARLFFFGLICPFSFVIYFNSIRTVSVWPLLRWMKS